MAAKTIGSSNRIKLVAMVNPRGAGMAAKKKGNKGGKKGSAHKKAGGPIKKVGRRRGHRRGNPSMTIAAAFVGGVAARIVTGVARTAADNMPGGRTAQLAARVGGALLPVAGAYLLEKKAPHLAMGMAGASGAATTEEVGGIFSQNKDGSPNWWAKVLGLGDWLELEDGTTIFVDDQGKAWAQAVAKAGEQKPAAVPVLGAPFTFQVSDGQRQRPMQACLQLADGGVVCRDPMTGQWDVLNGVGGLQKLRGLVRMGGLVRVSAPRVAGLVRNGSSSTGYTA